MEITISLEKDNTESLTSPVSGTAEGREAVYTNRTLLSEWIARYSIDKDVSPVLRHTAGRQYAQLFEHDRDEAFVLFDRICDYLYKKYATEVSVDLFEKDEKTFFEFCAGKSTDEQKNNRGRAFGTFFRELGVLGGRYQSAASVEEGNGGTERVTVCFEYVDIGNAGFKADPSSLV